MAIKKVKVGFTDESVMNKILLIRNKKVMIDRDLAELYAATTKRLNEQVKRNMKKFPKDFMFQLTLKEKDKVVSHFENFRIIYGQSLSARACRRFGE